jgi:hypothetical protein
VASPGRGIVAFHRCSSDRKSKFRTWWALKASTLSFYRRK